MPNRTTLFVFFLTALGAFFHLYNLNWGAPFYFHPDERNIASSVSQLGFPEQLNPNFFAYGSLPIYSIFFTGLLANNLFSCQLLWDSCEKSSISFSQAIVISRFYASLFSTFLIPLLFFLGKQLRDEKTGLLAAFFATTSVGFIQFAHFGTFEMWLTFFSVLLLWSCIQVVQKKSLLQVALSAIFFGILLSTKVSSLVLLPLPLFAIILKYGHKPRWTRLLQATKALLMFMILVAVVYLATNPYMLLDRKGFANSMRYESGVATGTIPVFYTAEFYDTVPVVFQLWEVFPFLLNPLMLLLAIPSFFYILLTAKKTKHKSYFLLLLFFLVLLLSQAVLFVKWTRYMVPILPLIYLMIAITITSVSANKNFQFSIFNFQFRLRLPRKRSLLAVTLLIGTNTIFALSYFITAFVRPDTRVEAAEFAKARISRSEPILSEVYDLGIVAFNESFPNIKLYNFYDLDLASNSPEFNETTLAYELTRHDYIVLPSQRVIKSRLEQPDRFPKAHKFYTELFNGTLGYQKIYETPCDIFCQITYLGNPSFRYEQTANVFDRPTVYIFKKM